MRLDKELVVITDIGSTTTKALLLDNREKSPFLLGISSAATTVEAPVNDVAFGIKAAVRILEAEHGLRLLNPGGADNRLDWADNVAYLSTSSAGGGLQILVIGLTLFDSASSGKRAAYGAGGVILDTFAIDDKRQAMEQMLAMRNLHPDMILLCGGTDGGAVSGVLRMAEIVRIANPLPKFDQKAKIPALYAGNRDAAPIIEKLISREFDLYIMPNLRPSLEEENLQPTQDKIQQLFMENVMEHAPGYQEIKPGVASPIVPTPIGVHKALALASGAEQLNIFAFDIGGATTDVFSFIHGHFQRTVSANLGMSYSIWNVLKECSPERILRWLPARLDEATVRNYIANKCLHPTSNPRSTDELRIEHAVAREALSLALEQHRQMHYNGSKVGYLDKLKNGDMEKFELQFEYQREDQKHRFKESDIDVLIGAGGIFAHASEPAQCALLLIDAVRPKGITEVWIDRRFISPHLGVLSDLEPDSAKRLLASDCLQKIALHVAPAFSPREKRELLTLEVTTNKGKNVISLLPGSFHYLPEGDKTLKFSLSKRCQLTTDLDLSKLRTSLPVILDSRLDPSAHRETAEQALRLYATPLETAGTSDAAAAPALLRTGTWSRRVELPYNGEVLVNAGDQVEPETLVALNRYNPPRLFIVNGFSSLQGISEQQIADSLSVKPGDALDFDQVYAILPPDVQLPAHYRHARKLSSPVRGRIEYIDPHTGIMVLSEIQNYSSKPVTVNYAEGLLLKPRQARRYLLRQEGDFVFHGDVLARRIERNANGSAPAFVKAPNTGTITNVDAENGTLTIAYKHSPLEFPAHVNGTVTAVEEGRGLEIEYKGSRLEGKIAFGRQCHGQLMFLATADAIAGAGLRDCIVALGFAPGLKELNELGAAGVRGVVCHELEATDLTTFLGFEPGVINTGNEALAYALLVLNGFGSQPLPGGLASLLAGSGNCYLNPHTRIRAGVVRPFISF